MGRGARQTEIISFKADPELTAAMRGIPNRSEFIRAAILAALDGVCPVCRGTGILTGHQQSHWREFSRAHSLEQCGTCQTPRLVCHAGEEPRDPAPDTGDGT